MTPSSVATPAAQSPRSEAPVWNRLLALTLAGLGFFLPFSSAGVAIAVGALVALALARPRAIRSRAPWQEPVMAAGLVLLAYIAVHTLWTTGLHVASWHAVNKYQELWIAPLLLALLHDARHRRRLHPRRHQRRGGAGAGLLGGPAGAAPDQSLVDRAHFGGVRASPSAPSCC